MEWDFTTAQIIQGKAKYTLEEYLRDLKEEVRYNFPDMEPQKREMLCTTAYLVTYLAAIKKAPEEIQTLSRLPPDLVATLLDWNHANIEMLEAIIMRMFLDNLEHSQGMIGDGMNLEITNLQLRKFHTEHLLSHD